MKIHAQNSHLNLLFNVSILWALLSVTPPLEAAAVITATTTATPAVGADAEPGETVSYSITVTNDPTEAAQAVGYSVTLDANVTLTGGTIKTTPVALDDSYTGILGNVSITIGAAAGVLANDVDPQNGARVDGVPAVLPALNTGLTAVAGVIATPNGGSVTLGVDGGFIYNPPIGFTGSDSFTYTMTDGDSNTDTATVTLTVTAAVFWFVDNTGGGAGGTGSQADPFRTLAALNAAQGGVSPGTPQAGQTIHIATGSGTYDGGVTLLANQRLFGNGVSLMAAAGVTVPAGSTLPGVGVRPTITNTAGAGSSDGINLSSGNTVRGLDIGNTAGSGIAGVGVGALTISDVVINGTGGGVDFRTSGTLAVTLDSLSASSSTREGIRLTGVTGAFSTTAPTGVITTTGVPAIDINVPPGFDLSGLTLASVSSSGATNGIRLTNTVGGPTIAGDGATAIFTQPVTGTGVSVLARNGSGGTITNTGSHGVALNNATGLTLRQMNISNTGDDGINCRAQSGGFTLSAVDIGNTGGSCLGHVGVTEMNLTGICTINNGSRFHDFHNANTHAIDVRNGAQNLAALNIQDCTFENQNNTNGAVAIDFDNVNNVDMAINIDDCLFTNLFGDSMAISAGQTPASLGDIVANVRDSAFQNAQSTGLGLNGVLFGSSAESDLEYVFSGNRVTDVGRGAASSWLVAGLASNRARLHGQKTGNTISNIQARGAIAFRSVQNQAPMVENHVVDGRINNNTIDDVGREIVYIRSFDLTSDMDVEILSNNIGQTTPVGFASFNGGNFIAIDSNHRDSANLDIRIDGNNIAANAALPGGGLSFLGIVSIWTDFPAANNTVRAHVTDNTITNSGASNLSIHMDQFTGTTSLEAEVDGNTVSQTIQLWEENAGQFQLRSQADVSARNGGATVSFPGSAGAPTNSTNLPALPTFNFPNT